MNRLFQIVLLVSFTLYSGTLQAQKAVTHHLAPGSNPMSCFIEGQIIRVLPLTKADKGLTYPCRARVRVLSVSHCGSSVPMSLNVGDIIEIKFVYTLHSTSKTKDMQIALLGLKKGNRFMANAEEHLQMGNKTQVLVYEYEVK